MCAFIFKVIVSARYASYTVDKNGEVDIKLNSVQSHLT